MFVCRRCAAKLLDARASRITLNITSGARSISNASSKISNRLRETQEKRSPRFIGTTVRNGRTKSREACYSTTTTTTIPPFRLAIIGSGPAGFYTASRVLKHAPSPVKIDMYERLPVPYGLVRYGVAPDHPEVKNCQERFDEIASSPGFEFVGNVEVGKDVSLDVLRRHYDAILFTYGAAEDRVLGIEGENLKGVWSARAFVAWYNGLPGFEGMDFDLVNAESAAIIGQGNVSLDVARILLTPVADLRKTDIPEHVLQKLSESRVRSVSAIGRRGPLQAAFTIKEIRELTTIPDVNFGAIDPSFFPSDMKTLPRARRRTAELLLKASSKASPTSSAQKHFELSFLLAPTRFKGKNGRLQSLTLQHQQFANPDDAFDPTTSVQPIPESFTKIETPLAFRSIGYKSLPLPGLDKLGIRFDTRRGIIPNERGRVVVYPTSQPGIDVVPQTLPGLYVAGWVKRGPTGVIASTMEDAFATGDCIVQDLESGHAFLHGRLDEAGGAREGWEGVQREAEGLKRTTWRDWSIIDRAERERGANLSKEREKIVMVEEMLRVLDG